MDEISLAPNRSKTLGYIGAVLAAVPFVVSSTTVQTVNGHVVAYHDSVALGCGISALIAGAIATMLAARAEDRRSLTTAVIVLAAGAFQILRGLGAFAH